MYYNKLRKREMFLTVIGQHESELQQIFEVAQRGNYTQQEIQTHLETKAYKKYKKNNIKS